MLDSTPVIVLLPATNKGVGMAKYFGLEKPEEPYDEKAARRLRKEIDKKREEKRKKKYQWDVDEEDQENY
jgi:hypothetical protein